MLELIVEHQDRINLILIKITGTALTALTIGGYLDAVSNWSWLLNIHIVLFSVILLMINLLGYSVYLIKMKRDSASDATLLNHLYTGLSIINQANSTMMFALTLGDVLVLSDSIVFVIEFSFKFLTSVSIGNLVTVTGATLFKHLSPTGYLRVSQNKRVIRIIMAAKVCVSLLSFLLAVWQCESELYCVGVWSRVMWSPLGVICFLVLFKIADDNYKFTTKMKLNLTKVLRRNNSVSPQVDLNTTVNQVFIFFVSFHNTIR